ncbi:hypothetical protein BKA64DRAFT_715206 [Cadophora sp. MPI-SDFR-AT-0126]|nr:hypothetical protein BKA64DRAFT_715206 [Leotiomycetes sp. MPI-SDFR-AT-0126]
MCQKKTSKVHYIDSSTTTEHFIAIYPTSVKSNIKYHSRIRIRSLNKDLQQSPEFINKYSAYKVQAHGVHPPDPTCTKGNYHAIQRTKAKDNQTASKTPKAEKHHRKSLRDPSLTPHGINEAIDLRHRLPYMSKITHILTSPLRRTLQTTILAFEPAIKAGIKPIALDILRETGKSPNNWGSDLPSLLEELADLGRESIVTNEVEPGWEIPPEFPVPVKLRSEQVKFNLRNLARVARMAESERVRARSQLGGWSPDSWCHSNRWLMMHDIPFVEKRKEIHVAVVSHGSFLKKLIGAERENTYLNVEYRTFVFEDEEGGEGDYDCFELVETEESVNRAYLSTSEEAIAERTRVREAAEAEAMRIYLTAIAKQALVRVEQIEMIEEIEMMDVDVMEVEIAEEMTLS